MATPSLFRSAIRSTVQVPKCFQTGTVRSFHRFVSPAPRIKSVPKFEASGLLAVGVAGRRFASTNTLAGEPNPFTMTPAKWRQIGLTVLGIAGGAVAINMVFNRETREALAPIEREHLNKTFQYTGAGLGVVALAAITMHRNGLSLRIMKANPWLVMGVSLAGSIGSMIGVFNTSPDKPLQKSELSSLSFSLGLC